MATPEDVLVFVDRYQKLLTKERDAELEQSSLLLSKCPPKLLEQRGLALVNLGVANIHIGLGGRRFVPNVRSF
jgi:DNA polymerase alpha-associated DNA helicase A